MAQKKIIFENITNWKCINSNLALTILLFSKLTKFNFSSQFSLHPKF